MKHFEIKNVISGKMGGKSEQEPAKLNPPDPDTNEDVLINNMTFQAIDVISEGPIEGFVNEGGENVTAEDIPQAIYLDEVPMMNPSGSYNFQRFAYDTRLGFSNQDTLRGFNRPSMEYNVNRSLFGPHVYTSEKKDYIYKKNKKRGGIAVADMIGKRSALNGQAKQGWNSIDVRVANDAKDFSKWWDATAGYINEVADPATHIIKNKDCIYFSFTLGIQQLFDTCSIDKADGSLRSSGDSRIPGGNFSKDYKAGVNYATICEFDVVWGRITLDGSEEIAGKKHYVLYGMATSQTFIDFGSNNYFENPYKVFQGVISNRRPGVNMDKYSFPENWGGEDTSYKFLRITKTTPETYSTLIKRSVSLAKVCEYSPMFLQYPLCALGAVKSDARTFSSVPKRAYLARLMKVFVPVNYQPMITELEIIGYEKDSEGKFILDEEGNKIPIYKEHKKDRRRYIRAIDKPTEEEKLQVYVKEWDYVSLEKKWTDNPIWIVLDLLTNSRYGLGAFIKMEDIDMFSFYEVARYCDGVDEEGLFVGFPNGFGGLEPRFSFSAVLKDRMKTLEVITSILGLIDASLYWNNGKISLTHKESSSRIRALYNNRNVVDGLFIYTSSRRDERYNLVEVTYNDENDLYKSKVEFRMNESDLKDNGVVKVAMNAWGCCSKGMAQRIGDRFLAQTAQATQTVSFSTGYDALLLQLNDLFLVDDDLMNLVENYARLISVEGPDTDGYLAFTVDAVLDLSRAEVDEQVNLHVYRNNPNQTLGEAGQQAPETVFQLVSSKWSIGATETIFYVHKRYVGPELGGFHIGSVVSISLKDNSTQIYRLSTIRDEGNGTYTIVGTYVSREQYEEISTPLQNHYRTLARTKSLPLLSNSPVLYSSSEDYNKDYKDMADDEYDEMMGILPAPGNLAVEESFDGPEVGYLGRLTLTWDAVPHASAYKIIVKNSANQIFIDAIVSANRERVYTFSAESDKFYFYMWTLNADDLASRYPSSIIHYFVDEAMALRSPEITLLRAEGRR